MLSRGSKASRTVVSAPQFLDDHAGAASSLSASLAMDVSLFRGKWNGSFAPPFRTVLHHTVGGERPFLARVSRSLLRVRARVRGVCCDGRAAFDRDRRSERRHAERPAAEPGERRAPPPLRSPAHSSSAPAPRRRRDARGAPQPKMYDVRVCAHDLSKITPTSNGGGAGAPIAVFKLDAATCVPRPVLLVNRAAARGGERRRRRRRRRRASPGNGRWSTMVAGWWSSRWWWWCGAATVR